MSSLRAALAGPSGTALRWGAVGAVLLTLGGFGSGALPVDGGPAAAVGLLGYTFGHGALLALVLCWIGVGLLVTSWLALGPRAVSGRLPTRDAVWATTLWSAPLLPAMPLFSRDAWSYLAQGAMAAAGVSPYEHGPEASPGAFTDEVSPDWRSTVTPYGPLHLLLLRAVVALSGGDPTVGVLLLRVVVLATLAGLVALLVALARRTGVDAGTAVWAACASPLAVIHFAGGLHNEIFPLAACVAAVVLALDGRRIGAGAAIGLAVAVKATAVVVAPFLLWILLARWREARRPELRTADGADAPPPGDRGPLVRAVVDTVPAVLAAAAVLVVVTLVSGTGSGWLDAIAVSDRVVNYLSLPTAVAHLVTAVTDGPGFEDVLAAARDGGRVVLALALVAAWWAHRRGSADALRGIMVALLLFVLLNSLAWPWYHVWVAAFWVSARPGRGAWTAGVAGTVFLVLAIGPNGSTSLYSPGLAALAVVAAGATAWWWSRSTTGVAYPTPSTGEVRTPSPAPDA